MSHRHSPRHRHNGRPNADDNRPPLVRAYSSTSSDSLPELSTHSYYELVPGSMIDGRHTFAMMDEYYPNTAGATTIREPRIHYDDRTWSKETSKGLANGDAKQGALVMMAASLFGVSLLAGTVLFAYYILSCYGVY